MMHLFMAHDLTTCVGEAVNRALMDKDETIFWLANFQLLHDLSITEISIGKSNYFLPGGKPLKNQEAI
jgi:hypothetical protein